MDDTIRVHERILGRGRGLSELSQEDFRTLKQYGYSDAYLAKLLYTTEMAVRSRRKELGVIANFYRVDTCAAEFEARTPYLYSTYEQGDEAQPTNNKKIM